MPYFTDWQLERVIASGVDAQNAWAAGDWQQLAGALLEHAARTGELGMVARLLEQEARNDEHSLLLPHLAAITALPGGPLRDVGLTLAGLRSGHDPEQLLQALDALRGDDPATACMVALCLAWRFADRALWSKAARFDALAMRALDELRACAEPPAHLERLGLSALAVHAFVAWSVDGDERAVDELHQALASARARNALGRHHALPLVALGRVHATRGDWQRAALHLGQGVHLTPASAVEAAGSARAMLVLARYRFGDWRGADLESRSTQQLLRETPSPALRAIREALAALQQALAGDAAASARSVDAARQHLLQQRSVIAEALLLHARIMLAMVARDWEQLHGVLDLDEQPGHRRHYTAHEWFALGAFAAHNAGDGARHRALLERWRQHPEASLSALHWAHHGLRQEAEGDVPGALAAIERMRSTLRLDDDPLGRVWVRWVIGSLETRHRDAEVGRRERGIASIALERLGASGFAAYSAAQLQRAETRPPRALLDAVAALTPQQRRVADLVAEGWTSAEIAERLFLSKRTVDFHVANVLDRLGLGHRREIHRVLEAARGAD